MQYGQDYDPNTSFFKQFDALNKKVPYPAVSTNFLMDENSEYTNYGGSNKNCYLIFHADYNWDCYYGYGVKTVEASMDMYNVFESNFMYQCVDCLKCYDLAFSQDCEECSRSYFLRDCVGCKDCICCVNLRQQQYCIFNKKYTKEEYEQKKKEMNLHLASSLSQLQTKLQELSLSLPHKCVHINYNENGSGDYVYYSKNVSKSFNVNGLYDGKFCYQIYNGAKDCYDMYQFGLKTEKIYEWSIVGYDSYNLFACHTCSERASNLCYCAKCTNATNLFGCVGVRNNKEYCILNKQYTKDEYEELVPQIIEKMKSDWEWWEFFPAALSQFGYNETTAQEYFPLSKDEAIKQGFNRSDYEAPFPQVEKILKAEQLPPDISLVSDDILKRAIQCEVSKKPFRIIPQELAFYRKHNLPLPHRHPDVRHAERFAMRNPRKLRDRKCMKCWVDIQTSFAPEMPEVVYCEACYDKEVY